MAKSPEETAPTGIAPEQRAALVELRKFELSLLDAASSFGRWVESCAHATGVTTISFSSTDVTTLRLLACSNRAKRASEISFALNIEDIHIVTYSLKKLARGDYVNSEKVGKELFFSPTDTGKAFLEDYDKIRISLVLEAVGVLTDGRAALLQVAQVLRAMSGVYDQAARAATTL